MANAFFASVTRAALDDAIAAASEGDQKASLNLLSQVSNNMAAIEDMHRYRMLYLDLTSDPQHPQERIHAGSPEQGRLREI